MFPYKPLHPFYNAEGSGTVASGVDSHAEGYNTAATNDAAHAEGNSTLASGSASHAEGYKTTASLDTAHAEGNSTIAEGSASHAEGFQSVASANTAHAEGTNTTASAIAAHAEGEGSVASGPAAHAEGDGTVASAEGTHAEGGGTKATIGFSHAEGFLTLASGIASHAEGSITVADGSSSHAEGYQNVASGFAAHVQNYNNRALGYASHAEGNTTVASHEGSHVMGIHGGSVFPYSWHLAYGTAEAPGVNAVIDAATGNVYIEGTVISPSADYAEMFETVDGQPLEPGVFVTTVGEKIRAAQITDSYILGVVSAAPSMIGDAGELRWQGKYNLDEWGRVQYANIIVPATLDPEGNILAPEHTIKQAVVHPAYDPAREYIPRRQRPEWVAVGIVGKLLVRDDGTCLPDGYCRPSAGGIATAAPDGYRVLARTGPNQIKIIMK
jgi:hypothetical protein